MRPFAIAAAALALLAPARAPAQPVSTPAGAAPDTYLLLHAGAFLPQHEDLDAYDTGYDFGATFGARFTPSLGVEGELGYVRATADAHTGFGGAPVEETLEVIPLTASLRFRVPMKVAELSALAGGGFHFARRERTGGNEGVSIDTSDSSTRFGFHVGAELAFNLSPTMLVGFEARRTFVPGEFEGAEVNLGGLRLAATLGYHF